MKDEANWGYCSSWLSLKLSAFVTKFISDMRCYRISLGRAFCHLGPGVISRVPVKPMRQPTAKASMVAEVESGAEVGTEVGMEVGTAVAY